MNEPRPTRRTFLAGAAAVVLGAACSSRSANTTSKDDLPAAGLTTSTLGDNHMASSLARDGAMLIYEKQGSGKPLVFLHGVGATGRLWSAQQTFFRDRYTTVALDLRGHGKSVAPPETISIENFADDVAAVIDHLGLGPAHICGLSLGGIVALELWRRRPQVIATLVLADTWAYHPQAAAGLPARLDAIARTPLLDLARARVPALFGSKRDPALVEEVITMIAANDRTAYLRANEVLWIADMRSVAPTVRVPTLVLVGAEDSVTPPPLSEELTRFIPGATLGVIPDAGHLCNLEAPEEFNSRVAQFLSSATRS